MIKIILRFSSLCFNSDTSVCRFYPYITSCLVECLDLWFDVQFWRILVILSYHYPIVHYRYPIHTRFSFSSITRASINKVNHNFLNFSVVMYFYGFFLFILLFILQFRYLLLTCHFFDNSFLFLYKICS